ncbi:hypothetical protein ACJJID_00015 (plasmid) [Microbulbifer sp. CnH-101-G]|uniref:hypothetical protein n=1 Tax=Microbulbifer sp. CnH-101-G TaxID=3243393 RepID=UPI0040396BA1
MNKAIRIKLSEDIEQESDSLMLNDDEECYINLSYISQFYFQKAEIHLFLGDSVEGGTPIGLKFNKNSMGEYQRIKREIQEAFGISETSESKEAIA